MKKHKPSRDPERVGEAFVEWQRLQKTTPHSMFTQSLDVVDVDGNGKRREIWVGQITGDCCVRCSAYVHAGSTAIYKPGYLHNDEIHALHKHLISVSHVADCMDVSSFDLRKAIKAWQMVSGTYKAPETEEEKIKRQIKQAGESVAKWEKQKLKWKNEADLRISHFRKKESLAQQKLNALDTVRVLRKRL